MTKNITMRLYDTLGCTVISTALIQSIRAFLPASCIDVYTKNPELLIGLSEVNNIYNASQHQRDHYDIDLTDYLVKRDPQNSQPYRHLLEHQIEIAEEQMNIRIPEEFRHFRPKINLTNAEEASALALYHDLAGTKPLVWIQTKTSQSFKDWNDESWQAIRAGIAGL